MSLPSMSEIAGVRSLLYADRSVDYIAGVLDMTPDQVRLAGEGFGGRRPGYDTCHVGYMRQEGLRYREIAARLGLTWCQVRGALRRCGLIQHRDARDPLTTKEIQRVRRLRRAGHTTTQIAEKTGHGYQQVVVHSRDVATRREWHDEARRLYAQGTPVMEIARACGVTRRTVYTAVDGDRYGRQPPPHPQRDAIRADYAAGATYRMLIERYGVNSGAVANNCRDILRGRPGRQAR